MTACGEFRFPHRWKVVADKGGLVLPAAARRFLEERDRDLEDFLSGSCDEDTDEHEWFEAAGVATAFGDTREWVLREGSFATLSGTDFILVDTPGIWTVQVSVTGLSGAAPIRIFTPSSLSDAPFFPGSPTRFVGSDEQAALSEVTHAGLIAIGNAGNISPTVDTEDDAVVVLSGVLLVPGPVAAAGS